jgi:hypothetical protein
MSREVLQRLADATIVALSLPGGAWPRSLLSTTLIPDAWMGLVEKRDGRRWFVPAGEQPRLDESDMLVLVRNRPITVPVDLAGAESADGNSVDASCELLIRWPARDDDLAALSRALLAPESSGDLTLNRLAARVCDAGARQSLREHIRAETAERLVREDTRREWLEMLRTHLAKFCFETGASIEHVARLSCTSRTLAAHELLRRESEERLERIKARETVEQAALAATHKRLSELSGVLEKLKSAASDRESMRWHDLLPSLSPAERGRLLENLWRISPDRHVTTAVAVVAGSECVWLDPLQPERAQRRVTIPSDLGGLRSVAFDAKRNCLLVGAATGVWALDANDGAVQSRFAVPGSPTPKTGFNSAAYLGETLYATHSQLGVWSWANVGAGAPACLLEPAGGVPKTLRAITPTCDGRILFSADDCVQVFNPADESLAVLIAADDTIHALAVDGNDLYIGAGNGKILMVALNQPDDCWLVYRATGPIESIVVRRWNDLVELVVPAGGQGALSIYSQQNVISRVLDGAHPLRRVWASDDIVVGLNDRRDRLLVMNSNSPDRSSREVSLARLVGSSIQDACLVSAAAPENA